MPVLVNCSWCNKTMGSIALDKVNDWTKGEICDECLEKKAETLKAFEGVVARTKNKANLLHDEALSLLETEIRKIANQ